jgi:hypothetical protein
MLEKIELFKARKNIIQKLHEKLPRSFLRGSFTMKIVLFGCFIWGIPKIKQNVLDH